MDGTYRGFILVTKVVTHNLGVVSTINDNENLEKIL